MIFFLSVYGPDVVLGFDVIDYIFYSDHRGKHGIVLVVVSVYPRSSDKKKIIELVSEITNNVEMLVRTEIAGVSLGASLWRRHRERPVYQCCS